MSAQVLLPGMSADAVCAVTAAAVVAPFLFQLGAKRYRAKLQLD